jgi:hypothetical protein
MASLKPIARPTWCSYRIDRDGIFFANSGTDNNTELAIKTDAAKCLNMIPPEG